MIKTTLQLADMLSDALAPLVPDALISRDEGGDEEIAYITVKFPRDNYYRLRMDIHIDSDDELDVRCMDMDDDDCFMNYFNPIGYVVDNINGRDIRRSPNYNDAKEFEKAVADIVDWIKTFENDG